MSKWVSKETTKGYFYRYKIQNFIFYCIVVIFVLFTKKERFKTENFKNISKIHFDKSRINVKVELFQRYKKMIKAIKKRKTVVIEIITVSFDIYQVDAIFLEK